MAVLESTSNSGEWEWGQMHLLSMPFVYVSRFDIEEGFDAEALQWIDDVFLHRVLESQGWNIANRYRCLSGEPRELVIYGMSEEPHDPHVGVIPLENDLLARRLRNYEGHVFKQVLAHGEVSNSSSLINVVSTRPHPRAKADFDSWYSNVHVPEIVACPGWLNSRRYHRLNPDDTFLAIYQLEDAVRPFGTPEYEAAVGWGGFEPQLLGYHGFRIFECVSSVVLE